jgi:hypothetical protein
MDRKSYETALDQYHSFVGRILPMGLAAIAIEVESSLQAGLVLVVAAAILASHPSVGFLRRHQKTLAGGNSANDSISFNEVIKQTFPADLPMLIVMGWLFAISIGYKI